jgi:hypothetical protein
MFKRTLWRPSCADWHDGRRRGARRQASQGYRASGAHFACTSPSSSSN